MASLTLFTTAKPFNGHPGIIQRNALSSWARLDPLPEILLVGDEDGYAETAAEMGLQRVVELPRNEYGTPLISGIFELAREHGAGEILGFSNADIILPPAFAKAVEVVAARFPSFLMVGRRVDLEVNEPLGFDRRWWERLETRAANQGHERGDLAIDYFVFSRNLLTEIPPFAIGRTRYDNWLLWKAADEGGVLVDATPFVRVIHQNHDYGHIGGTIKAWEGPEAQRADELLGHWTHYHSIGHATYMVSPAGDVVPAKGLRYSVARPRRSLGHALRVTRPLRRRAKVVLAAVKGSASPGQSGPRH